MPCFYYCVLLVYLLVYCHFNFASLLDYSFCNDDKEDDDNDEGENMLFEYTCFSALDFV